MIQKIPKPQQTNPKEVIERHGNRDFAHGSEQFLLFHIEKGSQF